MLLDGLPLQQFLTLKLCPTLQAPLRQAQDNQAVAQLFAHHQAKLPAELLTRAKSQLQALHRYNVRGFWWQHWGDTFAKITPLPQILWVRGEADLLGQPGVGVVGARRASPDGVAWAFALGKHLAASGQVVFSGGALGIDAAAHRGALAAGGATVVMMGSSIDRAYPACHRDLFRQVLKQGGALVSEHLPFESTLGFHFALRNRLIAQCSSHLVVVEAGIKSGALGCAAASFALGRQVLVAPPLGGEREGIARLQQRGCATLLIDSDGAIVVRADSSVVEHWPYKPGVGGSRPSPPTMFV